MTTLSLNGFAFTLQLSASQHGFWTTLPLIPADGGYRFDHDGIRGELSLSLGLADRINYRLHFASPAQSRLRLVLALLDQQDLFHLIPGNIHGDNNAAHVRAGEFPCLTKLRPAEKNCCAAVGIPGGSRVASGVDALCRRRGGGHLDRSLFGLRRSG